LGAEGALLGYFVRDAVLLLEDAGWERFRGDAACEGCVVVDVEFEEVEELVRDKVNCAVYFALDAEEEFEGAPGFVAHGEGYVL
jgi:hypothetical protein